MVISICWAIEFCVGLAMISMLRATDRINWYPAAPIRFADNGSRLPWDIAVFNKVHAETRNVDDNEFFVEAYVAEPPSSL